MIHLLTGFRNACWFLWSRKEVFNELLLALCKLPHPESQVIVPLHKRPIAHMFWENRSLDILKSFLQILKPSESTAKPPLTLTGPRFVSDVSSLHSNFAGWGDLCEMATLTTMVRMANTLGSSLTGKWNSNIFNWMHCFKQVEISWVWVLQHVRKGSWVHEGNKLQHDSPSLTYSACVHQPSDTVASHKYTVKCELTHGNAGCKHICTLFSNSLQFACCVVEKTALTQ